MGSQRSLGRKVRVELGRMPAEQVAVGPKQRP